MKRNNIYTALLSLSLLGLGACSLDLEPLTSPSSASYPSSMVEGDRQYYRYWCYTCQHGYVYGINHLRSFC